MVKPNGPRCNLDYRYRYYLEKERFYPGTKKLRMPDEVLERFRYPLPPMVLGIVLGPLVEANFRKMLAAEDSLMPLFTKPIALTFIVLSVLSLIWASRLRRRMGADVETGDAS